MKVKRNKEAETQKDIESMSRDDDRPYFNNRVADRSRIDGNWISRREKQNKTAWGWQRGCGSQQESFQVEYNSNKAQDLDVTSSLCIQG